jgi:hypothetical protein
VVAILHFQQSLQPGEVVEVVILWLLILEILAGPAVAAVTLVAQHLI